MPGRFQLLRRIRPALLPALLLLVELGILALVGLAIWPSAFPLPRLSDTTSRPAVLTAPVLAPEADAPPSPPGPDPILANIVPPAAQTEPQIAAPPQVVARAGLAWLMPRVEAPPVAVEVVVKPPDSAAAAGRLALGDATPPDAATAEPQAQPQVEATEPVSATGRVVLDVPHVVASPAQAATGAGDLGGNLPREAHLDKVGQVWQTLNNCGPASVSMVLAYYGYDVSQSKAQTSLRNPREWGMLPGAVPPYVTQFDLEARILDHGKDEDLKALLRKGVPVIVAQWLTEVEPIPHYRVVTGYDDKKEVFYVNDGVLGFGKAIQYADFDGLWDVYHNLYLPIYQHAAADDVRAMLGKQWDHTVTYVTLFKSRPGWDEVLRTGGPDSTPSASPANNTAVAPAAQAPAVPAAPAAPAATPTPPLNPNWTKEAALPLLPHQPRSEKLMGKPVGSLAFYTLTVVKPEEGHKLVMHFSPDNALIGQGFGVRVYGQKGDELSKGDNWYGRGGERTWNVPPTPGTYMIQVYNYIPQITVEFTLTWE